MSYSNNGDISGITGLTNLKDCYQGNGEKRLNNFIFLRRLSNLSGGTTGKSIIITDSGYLPICLKTDGAIGKAEKCGGNANYYAIPGFMIDNYNIEALGALDNGGPTENYYQHSEMSYEKNYKPSTQKQGKYIDYYPTFLSFAENFSTNRKSVVQGFNQYQGKIFWDSTTSLIGYTPPAGVVQSDTPVFAFLTGTYTHTYPKINQSLEVNIDTHENITPIRRYSGEGNILSSDVIGRYEGQNNNYTLDTDLFNRLFMYPVSSSFSGSCSTIGKTVSAVARVYGEGATRLYSTPTVTASCDLTISRHLPGYTHSNGDTSFSQDVSFTHTTDGDAQGFEPVVFHIDTNKIYNIPFYFRGSKDSFYPATITSIPSSYIKTIGDNPDDALGRVYVGPLASWTADYKLDSDNYGFFNSAEEYQCPVFIASKPLLNFERVVDNRTHSYAYKAYMGSFPATMESTGGTISFYLYVYNEPQLITLTIDNDSSSASQVVGAGRIGGDGVEHTSGNPGCLCYQQDKDDYSYDHGGFGIDFTLYPRNVTLKYSEGSIFGTHLSGGEIYGGYIYGKLMTLYSQDEHVQMKIDTGVIQSHTKIEHSFLTSAGHPITILYSRLEGGYDPNNLAYIAEHSDTQLIPITKVNSSESIYNPEGYENCAPYYELTGTIPSTITFLLTTPTELRGLYNGTISGRYTTIASYSDTVEGVHITEELIYDSDTQRIFCTYHHQDETDDEYGYSDLTVMAVFAAAI